MKLATWNVQRLTRTTSVRMSRVRPYLDAINADIWVLTETGEDVSPGPGYQGVATTEFDRSSHYPDEVWTKIWSRWPIERLAPVSDPARCVAARVVPPHRAPFIVYGTVLLGRAAPGEALPTRAVLLLARRWRRRRRTGRHCRRHIHRTIFLSWGI